MICDSYLDSCQCACHVSSSGGAQVLKDSSMAKLNTSVSGSSTRLDGLKCRDGSKSLDGLKCSNSSKCVDSLKFSESLKCEERSKELEELEGSKCMGHSFLTSVSAMDANSERSIAGVPLAIDQPEDKDVHQTTSKDSSTEDDKDFKPATKRYRHLSPDRVSWLNLWSLIPAAVSVFIAFPFFKIVAFNGYGE